VTAPNLEIPAAWLVDGAVMPARCVRHGGPATRRVDLAVRCRPARSGLLVPGRKPPGQTVRVAGWPLCRRCVRVRFAGLALATGLFAAGLLALVGGFAAGVAADRPRPVLLVPILGGLAAMLASAPALVWAGLPRLTRVRLTADSAMVQVLDPHPDFEARLRPVPRAGRARPAGARRT
jgi:hypothetical protein